MKISYILCEAQLTQILYYLTLIQNIYDDQVYWSEPVTPRHHSPISQKCFSSLQVITSHHIQSQSLHLVQWYQWSWDIGFRLRRLESFWSWRSRNRPYHRGFRVADGGESSRSWGEKSIIGSKEKNATIHCSEGLRRFTSEVMRLEIHKGADLRRVQNR